MYSDVKYREARRRAIRRLVRDVLFYADLVFTLIVWWILLTPHTVPDQAYTWWLPVFPIHALYYFRVHRLWSRLIDYLTQRELDRAAGQVKSKRDEQPSRFSVGRLLAHTLFGANILMVFLSAAASITTRDGSIALWLPLLIVHSVFYFRLWPKSMDRLTKREMAQEPEQDEPEKARFARLVDDGELLYEDEFVDDMQFSKRKNTA